MKHYSVLLEETIEGLNIKETGIYVDATLGYAGHSKEILKKIKRGFLFAFDQDQEAIDASQKVLAEIGQNYQVIHHNFCKLEDELAKKNINAIDGIIFDLGLSSPQIDDIARGFTFMQDATLDMRMNQDEELTAADIINTYTYDKLWEIFFAYGEEKKAKFIAKEICLARDVKKIMTTSELVGIIKLAVGDKYFYLEHPERKIFQAIRIEVNNELKVLKEVLPQAIKLLKPQGRICVITFHSLEDRIVKQIFREFSEINEVFKGLPDIPKEYQPLLKIINKKPILPREDEIEENSRSKSAKLRIAERL